MSEEPSDEGHRAWHRHFHPPLLDGSPEPLPPMRPPRHGFDFRRPVTTTPREDEVIDLTNEPETPSERTQTGVSNTWNSNTSRPPRFGRNILTDVVDLEEEEPANDPGEGPSSSPEVQFVRSTVRHQPSQRLSARMREILDSWTPRDLSTGLPPLSPGYTSIFNRFTRTNQNPRLGVRNRGYQGPATGPEDVFVLAPDGIHHDGIFLNYADPSFTMEPPSPPRPQRDPYRPPSPAPEGFTRTLGEEDVAICPNCSWELGTGKGRRQEIWVAKPCGHVCC